MKGGQMAKLADMQYDVTTSEFSSSGAETLSPPAMAARSNVSISESLDRFDEAFYLRTHTDVAEGVARGDWHSGLMHYAITGCSKGRAAAPEVDTDWYAAAYPMAAQDIAAGRATDLVDHYHRIGRYRGYLPDARAERPDNPAQCRSRYGGLWTDQGNALDIVEGRFDIGLITDAQAELLRNWITDGYVILPGAIPEHILAAGLGDLDRAYNGQMPDMRFAIHGVGQSVPWSQEALTSPAKALDLHWQSKPARNLIFAPAILDFLHLIFERRALASQTLGFWRGSQQNGHQDTAYVNYSLPMQFAATWIALEDVVEGAGELFYHVGSHRIAEYRFLSKFKGVEEAARRGKAGPEVNRQIDEHIDRIAMQADGLKLETDRLMAKRGDVLIWSADLAHGGSTISAAHTRKSLVTHYCPADLAPSYFEMKKSEVRAHNDEALYSSGHYGTIHARR
jgi:phytanoyl-CoA hydroxylase